MVEARFNVFKSWSSEQSIEKILVGLKNEMIANKKTAQPADGEMF